MNDNFDLRKYLVENKVTTNSKLIVEVSDSSDVSPLREESDASMIVSLIEQLDDSTWTWMVTTEDGQSEPYTIKGFDQSGTYWEPGDEREALGDIYLYNDDDSKIVECDGGYLVDKGDWYIEDYDSQITSNPSREVWTGSINQFKEAQGA